MTLKLSPCATPGWTWTQARALSAEQIWRLKISNGRARKLLLNTPLLEGTGGVTHHRYRVAS